MKQISFLILENCYFSGVNLVIDSLTTVNSWLRHKTGDPDARIFDVEIVSADGSAVDVNGGLSIQPAKSLAEVESDVLLIPAIQRLLPPFAEQQETILAQVAHLKSKQTKIGTGSTGVFLLAESGLLDKKRATTNWRFVRSFQRLFPQVNLRVDEMLTEDDDLICLSSSAGIPNLVQHLIQTFCPKEIAKQSARLLLNDPHRAGQGVEKPPAAAAYHGDREIAQAQRLMAQIYGRSLTIDSLAAHVNISPRHFKRRFKKATGQSPLQYLQQIRIEAGKERLEKTRETISEITYQIGYEDSSTFRRLFKRQVGVSPKAYRDRFLVARSHSAGQPGNSVSTREVRSLRH